EPAGRTRIGALRVVAKPLRSLRAAARAAQLLVETRRYRHERSRQHAITSRQPPIRRNRIQSSIAEGWRCHDCREVGDVPPVEGIGGVRVECSRLAIAAIEVPALWIEIARADTADQRTRIDIADAV